MIQMVLLRGFSINVCTYFYFPKAKCWSLSEDVAILHGLPFDIGKDNQPVKSLVVGRPILLALEDTDGGPSFLEKALRFLEKYGKFFILMSCSDPL